MGEVTRFTEDEKKAMDYADAFSSIGYPSFAFYQNGFLSIKCLPELPFVLSLSLLLPEHAEHSIEV